MKADVQQHNLTLYEHSAPLLVSMEPHEEAV